jgi:Ras family
MPGSNERQRTYLYNCLMYGTLEDSQVLASRFCTGRNPSPPYLNNVPLTRKKISILDRDVTVKIYTQSISRFGNNVMPTASCFRQSLVAITFLVFDINDEQSFLDLNEHIKEIRETVSFSRYDTGEMQIVLIGNIHDKGDFSRVDKKRAEDFAKEHELPYFETNTITGDNITEAFTCGIKLRLEKEQDVQAHLASVSQKKQDIVESLKEYKTKVSGEYSHSFSFLFRNPQRKNAKLQFVQRVINKIESKRNQLSDIEIRLAVKEVLMTNSKNNKSEITFKGVFDGILSHRCIDLICQITYMSREELHNMISDIYSSREKVNGDDSKYSESPAAFVDSSSLGVSNYHSL